MIDHVCVGVKDCEVSRDFYRDVLSTLGYELLMEVEGNAGFGTANFKPSFWISKNQEPSPQVHYCFQAKTRAAVRAFHQAALAAGAEEESLPGICEEYHPSYYATFVFDPDGYKIEAVTFADEA